MTPNNKRARANHASSGQHTAEAEEVNKQVVETSLRDKLSEAVDASVEAACQRAEERSARLIADATEAAGKLITEELKTVKVEAAEKLREALQEREALEQEKASIYNKAFSFQKNKIILNVGGQRFETSRQTLTSVPDTYLASMFSGRFELAPDVDDGSYFIDRNPKNFSLILDYLRDSGSSNTFSAIADTMGEQHVKELKTELAFYGLLNRMLPYCMLPYFDEDQIGRGLLRRACSGASTKRDIHQTAVAQARCLVFTIGSTTPFLSDKYQDLRFVITDRVVNGSPVWAAVDGKRFMFRNVRGQMMFGIEEACAKGRGYIYNAKVSQHVLAPTELPSDLWRSDSGATLKAQYASAERLPDADGDLVWVRVPEMCVTAVHGLDDDDPAMAAALKQLAALPLKKNTRTKNKTLKAR